MWSVVRESMQFAGEWYVCDDEAIRPTILIEIVGPDGRSQVERFLIDSGADRTVFRTSLARRLRLNVVSSPASLTLAGIGGNSAFESVEASLELTADDRRVARVRGEYAAFIDAAAANMSILGRDVLDNFDLFLSRRRNEVMLLAPRHQYQVITS